MLYIVFYYYYYYIFLLNLLNIITIFLLFLFILLRHHVLVTRLGYLIRSSTHEIVMR